MTIQKIKKITSCYQTTNNTNKDNEFYNIFMSYYKKRLPAPKPIKPSK